VTHDDHEARADALSRELESAFRNRADLYRLMWEELRAEWGAPAAERVMARAIEKRGREVAAAFAGLGPNDARAIGEAFLRVSPDGGRMYPVEVDRFDGGIAFRVKRCPLKDARPRTWPRCAGSPAPSTAACSKPPAFGSKTRPGMRRTVKTAATSG
jgi:hypothetical protein